MPLEIGTATPVDAVLPLTLDRAASRNRRGGHYLTAFARLNAGATINSASAEMDGIIARLAHDPPDEHDQGNFGIVVRSLREDRLGDSRPVLAILLAAVTLVLLVACPNVANLMLALGEAWRREMAVRAALGANRLRIVRQLLTESCVLSFAGAAAGCPPRHIRRARPRARGDRALRDDGLHRYATDGRDGRAHRDGCVARVGPVARGLPARRATRIDPVIALKAE